jgi:hypothetical protein
MNEIGGTTPAPGAARGSAVLRYAAFTDHGGGGNPAGVVLDAAGLDEAARLAIAARVGYSETAFAEAAGGAGQTARPYPPPGQPSARFPEPARPGGNKRLRSQPHQPELQPHARTAGNGGQAADEARHTALAGADAPNLLRAPDRRIGVGDNCVGLPGDRAQIILLGRCWRQERGLGGLPAVIGCPAAQW